MSIGHNSDGLRKIVTEARPLIEEWLDTAEKMAALRDVATDAGFEWGAVKALVKAQVQDERDDGSRVQKMLAKSESTTIYADMLGFGKNNFFPETPHDPSTGEIIEHAPDPRPEPAESREADALPSAEPSAEATPHPEGETAAPHPLASPHIAEAMRPAFAALHTEALQEIPAFLLRTA